MAAKPLILNPIQNSKGFQSNVQLLIFVLAFSLSRPIIYLQLTRETDDITSHDFPFKEGW
jgi:hypothetical protein